MKIWRTFKMNDYTANVELTGRVIAEPKVLTEYGIEKIFETQVEYKRTSGKSDIFVVNYSSGLGIDLKENDIINIKGTVRTTKYENITKIYIKMDKAELLDAEPDVYINEVSLKGVIAREPRIRKSYKDDETDIADLTVKVARNQTKVSYIPVVAWNNNARLAVNLKKDDEVAIKGRLQSHTTKNGFLMTEITTTSFIDSKNE